MIFTEDWLRLPPEARAVSGAAAPARLRGIWLRRKITVRDGKTRRSSFVPAEGTPSFPPGRGSQWPGSSWRLG